MSEKSICGGGEGWGSIGVGGSRWVGVVWNHCRGFVKTKFHLDWLKGLVAVFLFSLFVALSK